MPQLVARPSSGFGHAEQNQSPPPVPGPPPARLWVASAECLETTGAAQPMQAIASRTVLGFKQLSLFETSQLAKQSISVGPTFKGFSQIPKSRPGDHSGRPKQDVK